MKNLLILGSKCFDKSDATGVIARNFYDEFRKNTNCILLGYSTSQSKNEETEVCFMYKKHINCNPIYKKIESVARCFRPKINRQLVKDYYNKSREIIQKYNIKNVLAFYFPFEALIVAKKLKKEFPYLNVIDYEVDSAIDFTKMFSRTTKYQIASQKKSLKKIYGEIDKILILDSHMDTFSKTFGEIKEKVIPVKIPSLEKENPPLKKDDDKIVFTYAGSLNIGSYSPEPIFKLFENNKDKNNWELNFYSKGSCEEMIQKYCQKDLRVKNHGYINKKELDKKIASSNFLLSFTNDYKRNNTNCKLFTYFSSCNPVIHFAPDEVKDINIGYVSDYPLGFCVYPHTSNKDVLNFIDSNANSTVEYSMIYKMFCPYSVEYNSKVIIELLK